MAELSGKQALISYKGGQVAGFDNWDLTANTAMLDVTTFSTGTVQWRDFITGLSDFTATISGNFDAASTGLNNLRANTLTPATGTFKLEMDKEGGASLNGQGWISSMGHSAPIDGKVTVTFGIQGTGALTYTTTT